MNLGTGRIRVPGGGRELEYGGRWRVKRAGGVMGIIGHGSLSSYPGVPALY